MYVMYSASTRKIIFYTDEQMLGVRYCKDKNVHGQLIYKGFTTSSFAVMKNFVPELVKLNKKEYALTWS
jgi:hypothetical protein